MSHRPTHRLGFGIRRTNFIPIEVSTMEIEKSLLNVGRSFVTSEDGNKQPNIRQKCPSDLELLRILRMPARPPLWFTLPPSLFSSLPLFPMYLSPAYPSWNLYQIYLSWLSHPLRFDFIMYIYYLFESSTCLECLSAFHQFFCLIGALRIHVFLVIDDHLEILGWKTRWFISIETFCLQHWTYHWRWC